MCVFSTTDDFTTENDMFVYKVVEQYFNGRFVSCFPDWMRYPQLEGGHKGTLSYYVMFQPTTADWPYLYCFVSRECAMEHIPSSRTVIKCLVPRGTKAFYGVIGWSGRCTPSQTINVAKLIPISVEQKIARALC